MSFFTARVATKAPIPRTKPMFAMLDPITFPIINPESCLIDAVIAADNSGTDVPRATRVRPMRNSETPRRFAILDADSTKKSEPFIRRINPASRNKMCV